MEHLHDCDCATTTRMNTTRHWIIRVKTNITNHSINLSLSERRANHDDRTALLDKEARKNFTPDVLKHLHGCIDLTSLTSLDSMESI